MAKHESVGIPTSEHPGSSALEAPVDVAVAVVGGGIAGLSTVLLLKNPGLRVTRSQDRRGLLGDDRASTAKVSAQHASPT